MTTWSGAAHHRHAFTSAGSRDVPILAECAAWSVAQPQQRIHAGKYVIIVARLLEGEGRTDIAPLVKQGSAYPSLASG